MIKSIIKSIIRFLFKRPYYFIKRNLRKAIVVYLMGTSPISYLMTAATTQYSITQPDQIINVLKNSGWVNILTAGTFQPLKSVAQEKGGQVLTKIGELTNSSDLIARGQNLAIGSTAWFEQGKELANSIGEQTSVIKDKVVESSEKIESLKDSANQAITDLKTTRDEIINQSSNLQKTFDFYQHPDYYEIIGLSHIDESTFPEIGTIQYSNLDHLGRTQIVKGSLTYENVKSSLGKRGSFKTGGENEPSGWIKMKKGDEVTIPYLYGKSYHGYFYNRSHLIADQLGGEAIRVNAITGTRTQNVGGPNQKGGMRYSEKKATDWLKSNKNGGVLYYSAEPVYQGDELVARYVEVKMKSSDNSIDETIHVYNYANGWEINYQTGEYKQNG